MANLVDRYGREIARETVRRAAGFIERVVKAEETPTTTMPTRDARREPWWVRRGELNFEVPPHADTGGRMPRLR